MSDLQLSLLVIGLVVVAGVYLFNWWQERRLRRRLEQAFGEERDDVLLKTETAEPQVRVEPQFEAIVEDEPGAGPASLLRIELPVEQVEPLAAAPVPEVPWFDTALDYIAEIQAPAPISAAVIAELLSKVATTGKPCRAAGYSDASGEWEELARSGAGRHRRIRLALQLVTRNGALTSPQLAAFTEAVRSCAAKIGAAANYPDADTALQHARELDGFCAEVDVAIGINVVAPAGASFSGTKIRTQAEAAGFKLEPDGVFHFRDDARHTLFTLDNHEPLPFIPEQIGSLVTAGITLLLDVPRVADGPQALASMLEIAQHMAAALGGRLVDDNRIALNPAGIATIRQQLEGISSAMTDRGIVPGSERALRLFS